MKTKPLHPLVSCICITNNRPQLLLKAILSFDQQNYPNRELVVSYPKNDSESKELIKKILLIPEFNIIEIEREEGESIGTARNNAVRKCNGVYVCMWDDDDVYSHTRVADQHNLLQGNGRYFQASLISQILLFDAIKSKAYISHQYNWNGSLLCKREHLLSYPCKDSNLFECDPVIEYLESKKLLLKQGFDPQIYTYIYHGSNVTDYFHFQYLAKQGRPLADEFSYEVKSYLAQEIKINI